MAPAAMQHRCLSLPEEFRAGGGAAVYAQHVAGGEGRGGSEGSARVSSERARGYWRCLLIFLFLSLSIFFIFFFLRSLTV